MSCRQSLLTFFKESPPVGGEPFQRQRLSFEAVATAIRDFVQEEKAPVSQPMVQEESKPKRPSLDEVAQFFKV